jgi:hypothetical protein
MVGVGVRVDDTLMVGVLLADRLFDGVLEGVLDAANTGSQHHASINSKAISKGADRMVVTREIDANRNVAVTAKTVS